MGTICAELLNDQCLSVIKTGKTRYETEREPYLMPHLSVKKRWRAPGG